MFKKILFSILVYSTLYTKYTNAENYIIESTKPIEGAKFLYEYKNKIYSTMEFTKSDVSYILDSSNKKDLDVDLDGILNIYKNEYIEQPDPDVFVEPHDDDDYKQETETEQEQEQKTETNVVQPVPSSPYWGLDTIDGTKDFLYNYDYTGEGTVVYVIDSGISPHPDMTGKLLSGKSFIEDQSTTDCMGHGTFVASQIGGTKVGVAKNVKLVPLRIFGCSGGAPIAYSLQAMYWIIANKPAGQKCIVNMSFGSSFSELTNKGVRDLVAEGCVVVVSAGNSADNIDNYSPASEPQVLTVGAIDINNKIAYFSNEGDLDVFAPGDSVIGAGLSNSFTVKSGTSMASPIVAGVCAQVWEKYPQKSNVQVMQYIVDSAQKGILSGFRMKTSPNLVVRVPKNSSDAPTPSPTLRVPCKRYARRACIKRPRCRWLYRKKHCTER